MNETKKRGNANLPALILLAVLLMFWQAAAMGIDAAYILPSPTQILVRLWELRGPLFTAHLPFLLFWDWDLPFLWISVRLRKKHYIR